MTKYTKSSFAIIFFAVLFFSSCGTNDTTKDTEIENTLNKVEKDTTYAQYIKRNKIKTLTSKGFQYKFGEAQQPGFTLYVVHYNEEGLPIDSIIYNNNVIIGRFKNIYNTDWKLVNSTVLDSAGNEIESINRTFDKMGNETEFIYLKNQKPFYRQKIEYNDKNQMSKIVEFDDSDTPKIVTEYLYNEKGKKISKTEYNSKDVILSKESWVYDEKGNNIQYLIYDITGNILEKNYLKNFTEDGHPQLLEKYNEKDSLVVSHHYEYDSKGREIKSTLYNGINQILSQTNSQYDSKGNQISFEMYEGGQGLKGKDLITYNELNQEIELKVTGADGTQIKRKATSYNEQKLIFEVINYDKLDDPNFKIQYTYEYYLEN
jgi:hypothetical protein